MNRPDLQLAFLSSAAVTSLLEAKASGKHSFPEIHERKTHRKKKKKPTKQVEGEHPTARDQIRQTEAWIFFLALSLTCNTTPAPFLPQGPYTDDHVILCTEHINALIIASSSPCPWQATPLR